LGIVLAIAETMAIYFLNGENISFKRRWAKFLFFVPGLFYLMCNVPSFTWQMNRNMLKIILIFIITFIYLVLKKGKEIWKLVWFYCTILIFRSVCQLQKFIFLTIYCKTDMLLVEHYMENMTQTILLFYILFCIPGYFAARFIWGQFMLCTPAVLKITALFMLAIFFTTDFLTEWIQILITMPTVLLLFTLINILRIGCQNIGEYRLGYYKELESQMEESDRELEEIRREVEKYYKQANEEEHYTKQLLQKIDAIKDMK